MKVYVTLFVLIISISLNAQTTATPQQNSNSDFLLHKAERQKKTGNMLAITEGVCIATGLIVTSTADDGGWFFSEGQLIGASIFTFGVLSGLASFPFYISSQHNKKKYYKLTSSTGNVRSLENKNYKTVGLSLEF